MTLAVVGQQQSGLSRGGDIRRLTTLAIAGLPAMFDRGRNLFCYRVQHNGRRLVMEGVSHRYTIMTLLGLQEFTKSGGTHPFDTEAILASLTADMTWVKGIGDLGLLLWLVASVFPHHIQRLRPVLDPDTALKRYPARNGTMEWAWFLTGCAQLAISSGGAPPDASAAAGMAYEKLVANQGECGAFGHQSRLSSLSGILRGHVGSFADQVYPILAMTHMARAYNVTEPLVRAEACANVICKAQGDLGQWWWHYHSENGKVIGRYPVYSVHQHGMGPMALFALQEVSNRDYSESIYRGLGWINRTNELDTDLRDSAEQLVWRCILPRKLLTVVEDLAGLSGLNSAKIGPGKLTILRECRPYELGWLLYALAGRERTQDRSVPSADRPACSRES
jgi:hypothetical protein